MKDAMTGTEIEYWDTCVFLALLKNEMHRPGEAQYVSDQARKFDIGALSIVTSTLTVTEILDSKMSVIQIARLKEIFGKNNFQFIDANFRVCELASEIRSYYAEHNVSVLGAKKLQVTTPDAIQVASAIAAQRLAKQPIKLLTFDSDDKTTRGHMAMESLNGLVANKYRLEIGRPTLKNQQATLILPETNIPDVLDTSPPPNERGEGLSDHV